ncbi:MAG TPA: pyridoxamine 5'-phosphate oxidase [Actinomycetota bacterium]
MTELPDDEALTERDLDPDPIAQFRRWFEDARSAGIRYPEAMALATADAEGRPSVRHVLMRGLDDHGFAFYTNYASRKGRQIGENPSGAAVFLWRELERQVGVTGTIERVSTEESEAYFRTRPREARLGAWASRQSEVVPSREVLDERYREMEARFPGDEIPLPEHWGGFRLKPETVEFWKGRRFRLHDRFRYTRAAGGWKIERLYP